MYLAFVVIAATTSAAAWWSGVAEQRALQSTALLDATMEQRAFAQRMGRLALELGHPTGALPDPVKALARSLDESRLLAQRVDRQFVEALGIEPPVRHALTEWHRARASLWQSGETLLKQASGPMPAARTAAAQAVLGNADPAWEAAHDLARALREVSARQGAEARRLAQLNWAFTLVLLGILALVVVEPTARAVRRQHRSLADQATELERLALVAERTDNLVVLTDPQRRITWVNDAFSRVTGYTAEEACGRMPSDLLMSDRTSVDALARIREALGRGEGVRAELLNRSKSGRDYWVDIDIRPLRDKRGALTGFVGVETEITAIVTQRLKVESLLAALPDGVVVQGANGDITEANPAAERLLGKTRAQLLGLAPDELPISAVREDLSDYPAIDFPAMRTLRTGRGLQGEVMGLRIAPDTLRWLLVNCEPLRDSLGAPSGVVSCFVDVTDRRQLQDQLTRSSRTDALTGLPNRAVVLERIGRALAHRARHPGYGFAVLFMDFDRFKQVNDTHGHGAGDELLRQIAGRLTITLRPGDAVCRIDAPTHTAARIGGDEFVVVIDGVDDLPSVHAIAQRLLDVLADPYRIGHSTIQSSVSIGVVLSPDGDADGVLRDADTAMYEAKRAGRGCYRVFDTTMHERVAHALGLENDLRQALLQPGELFVVYQPIVDLGGGPCVGVEALVRWRHPRRGVVSPVEFIPVAEEAGLIGALGDLVLDAACTQFASWRESMGAMAPTSLSVNLSRAQLQQPGLVATVRAALERTGIPPQCLHLEVTESLAAQDELILNCMTELKGLGVRLALDDFGTGYSSLACLHQMPIDAVKIDRSFIVHVETSTYHRVVIEATLRVASSLGLTSVAEGIETPGQSALMMALGCRHGQGYLFSPPLPAQDLTAWLEKRTVGLSAPASAVSSMP